MASTTTTIPHSPPTDSLTTFHSFPHGHQDLLLAAAYNFYGTRLATASADHKIKIWDRVPSSSSSDSPAQWTLTTSFPAHDAPVTGLSWNGPYTGHHLASIGEDGHAKIWAEDPTEPANSPRRFRRIWQQRSPTGVPFVGVGFKFSAVECVLALTTRDGFLTVWEPNDEVVGGGDGGGGGEGEDLSSWKLWFEDHLCATPPRTEETSFRLSWHAEKFPPYPAILAGLDRKSLALAVAVGDKVRIYRTDKQRKFYVAATLEGARGLVRDVAWANGSMRGWDLVATCCRDGVVRIYEVHTPAAAAAASSLNTPSTAAGAATANGDSTAHQQQLLSATTPLTSPPTLTPSSTTTTLPKTPHHRTSSSSHPSALTQQHQRSSILRSQLLGGRDGKRPENSSSPGAIQQEAKLVAELEAHEGAPWRVAWSPLGEILVSTGDDGRVGLWRRDTGGRWRESGEVDLVGEEGR